MSKDKHVPAASWLRARGIKFTLCECDDVKLNEQVVNLLKSWKLRHKTDKALNDEVPVLIVTEMFMSKQKIRTLTGLDEIEKFFQGVIDRYNAFIRVEREAVAHEEG